MPGRSRPDRRGSNLVADTETSTHYRPAAIMKARTFSCQSRPMTSKTTIGYREKEPRCKNQLDNTPECLLWKTNGLRVALHLSRQICCPAGSRRVRRRLSVSGSKVAVDCLVRLGRRNASPLPLSNAAARRIQIATLEITEDRGAERGSSTSAEPCWLNHWRCRRAPHACC
jgi:hypothetical protein